MTNPDYRDFDAEIGDGISFKVKGTLYTVPADPEAKPILAMLRDGTLMDPAHTEEVLEHVVGKDVLEELHEKKIGIRALTMLAEHMMVELGFAEKPGEPCEVCGGTGRVTTPADDSGNG